ncbi:MAG: BCCT family transporter [Actinomycetaceae bacterium]|nr:BCCT family transporter [Actinomycetaceae bacterium]
MSRNKAGESSRRPRKMGILANKARRRSLKILLEMEYPHNLHPALVPGVSIEDQKIRYGIDKPILLVVGLAIIGFFCWGIYSPEGVLAVSSTALDWTMENLGWLYNLVAIGTVFYLLAIALSKYGKIPLGLDGEKPEFSTLSWAAMLFGAGIGIGIIFFGALEPLTHYFRPLPGMYKARTIEAVKGALAQSILHWGVNAWAIYAIVGLAVAYVSFRKGRVPLMSSILEPMFGWESKAWGARLIDGLAIIATLFGTAASLGIGALQITRGMEIMGGLGRLGNTVAIAFIVLLTIGTIISAVSGVTKGIRRLSNINLGLAIALAIFIFIAGPTLFLTNLFPGVITTYIGTAPEMLSATMADGPATAHFLKNWTTFFWAWWVSWAPFVGVFTAKISRGRTIRQFVLGVLLIPSSIIAVAFTVLGGTALWMQRTSVAIAQGNTIDGLPPSEEVFFTMLNGLPGGKLVAPIVIVMLAVFFITSSDSASLVNSQLSQGGNPNPKRIITAFWAVCMALIAVIMLLMGGSDALTGLQNLITITSLPFSIVLILMSVAFFKELRHDPIMIRNYYKNTALEKAVRRGIEWYGDNFEISIMPVSEASQRGAGAEFDSTSEGYTSWYARTDEDGNPVAYDYAKGEYVDEVPIVARRANNDEETDC